MNTKQQTRALNKLTQHQKKSGKVAKKLTKTVKHLRLTQLVGIWNKHQHQLKQLRQSGKVLCILSFKEHASLTWKMFKLKLKQFNEIMEKENQLN